MSAKHEVVVNAHDDRWCARCDAMEDAFNQLQARIMAIKKEEK